MVVLSLLFSQSKIYHLPVHFQAFILGSNHNKVQSISSVSLAGLPTESLICSSRRTSKGSLSDPLVGFEQLEVPSYFV